MLVHIKEIVPLAQKNGYAIGAFNTCNLEITLAIVKAAVAKKSPVIIQVSETTIKYAGLKPITHIVETIAKNEAVKIPIALHLDHGKSFHSVVECINAGFSSIHIDASELPLDENIALTKQTVEYAHKHGVWAQGEIGRILGKEGMKMIKMPNPDEYMTKAVEAVTFVKATKVDTLAVSVGTMHGLFPGQEKVNLTRLAQIREQIKIPLVLHGASGVPGDNLRMAVKNGIVIVNIDTALRQAFTKELRQTVKKVTNVYDPRKILYPSMAAVQKVVEKKIEILGSAGNGR